MGNSWRALMERSAQLLIDQPPLKGRISDLRIINTDNTAAAQNAVISNLILEKPDILLLEAASTTASNQVIQQACDAGIVVITYDQLAEAPCAWKLAPDFTEVGEIEAKWLVEQMGGKGKVFLDLGLAGASPAIDAAKGAHSVFDKYPDIKLVTYYSNFTPGEEQAQVASLVPAHPDVTGILTLHAAAYALDALQGGRARAGADHRLFLRRGHPEMSEGAAHLPVQVGAGLGVELGADPRRRYSRRQGDRAIRASC